jgi:hypothetical protein
MAEGWWRGGGGEVRNKATTARTEVSTWDLAQGLAFLLLKHNNGVIRLQAAGCGNIAVVLSCRMSVTGGNMGTARNYVNGIKMLTVTDTLRARTVGCEV